jgi:ABC-2 type transport system permease protein
VGAAIDADSDSQQFMMPVTLPLVFSIALASFGIKNPDGPISVFFSIFPLTSPVVMMTRIPFEPPLWQIIASVISLILAFLGTTWLAGKIYRTGILMYGKKVTYKELWKWLRHY